MKIYRKEKDLSTAHSKKTKKLNEAQRRSIDAGRKDIENGNYKFHEQVMEEMTIWLKEFYA